ncbi:MAG: transposase zinc-binding domain-containing protein [Verrucomicrobiae bacterium]|nr:transposase zinc-binding domain-containing protein [Verrucomicrobiae bacterium]
MDVLPLRVPLEYLVAFSRKGRWFCPSCHQRKVLQTAAHLVDHILLPVPHRHVVLALPKLLRPLFRRDRNLLRRLCTVAQQTLTQLLRTALGLPRGRPAFLLTLHTFGEYLDFHPHIHALMADGLLDSGGPVAPRSPDPARHSGVRFSGPDLRRTPPVASNLPATGGAHAWLEAHRIQRGCRPECVPGASRRTGGTLPVHPAQPLLRGQDHPGATRGRGDLPLAAQCQGPPQL